MQKHNLKRKTENKKSISVGRGGKRGKTSGRGGKGQTARAGHKVRPEMRDLIKKLPKLRGYAFRTIKPYDVSCINIGDLDAVFSSGDTVSPQTLVKNGFLEIYKGKNPVVKILGGGEVEKKLTILGCAVSKQAKIKIEKAGGNIK
ncbi:MAG: 50S ribosomal protein L15 [Minisyncoccia bacterium]